MKNFLNKTLGGLTKQYYFRQLFFGVLVLIVFVYMDTQGDFSKLEIKNIVFFIINTLLYPYSRYVYDSIFHFIIGDNVFWTSGYLLYFTFVLKLIMMMICWLAAIFIAPVGLLFLYFMNSKDN